MFVSASAREALLVHRKHIAHRLDVVKGPVVQSSERGAELGPELVDGVSHKLRDLDAETLHARHHVVATDWVIRHGAVDWRVDTEEFNPQRPVQYPLFFVGYCREP